MMNAILEKAILEQENETLTATVINLKEKNEKLEAIINAYAEESKILYKERAELKYKINSLEIANETLEEEIEALELANEALEEENKELDNECQRLSDALEENEGKVIHYVAVSLDVKYCVPLVSESALEASVELMNKCLAKGIPYGGFKIFDKSELL